MAACLCKQPRAAAAAKAAAALRLLARQWRPRGHFPDCPAARHPAPVRRLVQEMLLAREQVLRTRRAFPRWALWKQPPPRASKRCVQGTSGGEQKGQLINRRQEEEEQAKRKVAAALAATLPAGREAATPRRDRAMPLPRHGRRPELRYNDAWAKSLAVRSSILIKSLSLHGDHGGQEGGQTGSDPLVPPITCGTLRTWCPPRAR